jgi:hypothetical protein
MSIADLTFTYIGSPDLTTEANPLVYVFALGWKSLIITSTLIELKKNNRLELPRGGNDEKESV